MHSLSTHSAPWSRYFIPAISHGCTLVLVLQRVKAYRNGQLCSFFFGKHPSILRKQSTLMLSWCGNFGFCVSNELRELLDVCSHVAQKKWFHLLKICLRRFGLVLKDTCTLPSYLMGVPVSQISHHASKGQEKRQKCDDSS